jgi:large subunit ribosomal protein L29
MKAADVHNMKDDELVERLKQAADEQFSLRFQHATGELENTSRLGAVKRDVARLRTVAKERGIDVDRELKHDDLKKD